MSNRRAHAIALLSLAATMVSPVALSAEASRYSIVDHIPAPAGGAWDYALVDSAVGKLYLAQSGITSLDLKSHEITTGFVHANQSHGVARLEDGRLAVDDSKTKEILIFDRSGEVSASIPTSAQNPVNGMHALDALVFEPHSRLLVAVNGESGLLVLADVAQAKVTDTMRVGGHPEFAVADGSGFLYLNVNHDKRSEIVGVDIAARKVVKRLALPGCEGATGLAYDSGTHLLMSVCDNGNFQVVDAETGKAIARVAVGDGADAVMWDAKRRIAFVASGDAGTVSVIKVGVADTHVVQVIPTQKGTRLGAVDSDTGMLYLPTARFGPPKPPIPYPSVVPGSFEFLVIAPN